MYNFMQINKFLPFLASILNRASLYAATVHISVRFCISRSYRKNLIRINQELRYAQKLNAQYIVIHTGTRGKRTKIPLRIFKDRLTNLLSLTRIPILVEIQHQNNALDQHLKS